jgi:dihydrofolate reductase
MSRLILKMSISLDGFVGGPNGEVDWLIRTLDDDATEWINQTLSTASAHLIGRRTYADMVNYWPTSAEPLAAAMNTIPKIVFSRTGAIDGEPTVALRNASDAQRRAALPTTSQNLGWHDTRVLGNDLRSDIGTLKAATTDNLVAHGGASFAQSLIREGLVDEYRILVHPVVLGSGLPLFTGPGFDLILVDATTFPSGICGVTYRPAV